MVITPLKLIDLYDAWLDQTEEVDTNDENVKMLKKYGNACLVDSFGDLYYDVDDFLTYHEGLEEEEKEGSKMVKNIFGKNVNVFPVSEALPPNKTWVACLLEEAVSGKKFIRTSYFEDGIFWDSSSSKAEGIERAEAQNGKTLFNNKVVEWFKADL